MTFSSVTWVGKKCTSPLARARWKAVLTSSGRFAGTLTGAMPSGIGAMVPAGCGRDVLHEEKAKGGRDANSFDEVMLWPVRCPSTFAPPSPSIRSLVVFAGDWELGGTKRRDGLG